LIIYIIKLHRVKLYVSGSEKWDLKNAVRAGIGNSDFRQLIYHMSSPIHFSIFEL
jgi:hypothetical protein